jgi:hypothetical protein
VADERLSASNSTVSVTCSAIKAVSTIADKRRVDYNLLATVVGTYISEGYTSSLRRFPLGVNERDSTYHAVCMATLRAQMRHVLIREVVVDFFDYNVVENELAVRVLAVVDAFNTALSVCTTRRDAFAEHAVLVNALLDTFVSNGVNSVEVMAVREHAVTFRVSYGMTLY